MDCTLKLKVKRRLGGVKTSSLYVSSFTRTVGSIVKGGRLTMSRRSTRGVINRCFRRGRRRVGGRGRTGNGRTGVSNRGFLGRGTRGRNIIAATSKLRCVILRRNSNGDPGTASGIHYRCRNVLVSNALFSDDLRHNRPTSFPLGNIVTK